MRILVLTSSYPRFEGDYAGWFVQVLAEVLAGKGHAVIVAAPAGDGRAGRSIEGCGIEVERFPASIPLAADVLFYGAGAYENLRSSRRARLQVPFAATRFIAKALSGRGSADVLVSNWLVPSGLAGAAAKLAPGDSGFMHLCILHGSDVELARSSSVLTRACRSLACGIDAAMAVSRSVAARASQLLPGVPCSVLDLPPERPNGPVDASAMTAARKALDLDGRAKVCLFMGRQAPVKGLGVVLSAMSRIRGAALVCAGAEPSDSVERAARLLGVEVLQVGKVGRGQREALFAAADALVSGSLVSASGRGEGYPMVVREALARGLPVAAMPSGGLAWEGRGREKGLFLAKDLTSAGLASAMKHALAHGRFEPDLLDRLGGWERVVDQIEERVRHG